MSSMALTPVKICLRGLLLLGLLVLGASSAAVTNIPLASVSDLLIQSALDSLNEHSPTHHSYKSGNLISAQKLLDAPYVIYRLTLNLEANCNEETSCPREACAIDVRQHEKGVIDVEKSSIQCMYLHPQSSQDEIQQHVQENVPDKTESVQRDAGTTERMLQLDHEVETVMKNGSERPFIAVRATDRNYCAGCPYELNPTLPGLAAFGEQVVQKMDDSGRSDFKHKVVSIVRVTRAVPPGSNVIKYELNLEIGETNCPRSTLIERSECTLLPNVPIKLCLVTFEERPWQENSRTITGNNCTEIPDSDNELNSSYDQSLTVSESLTPSSAWRAQESPDFASSLQGFIDGTTAAAVTEEKIEKVVLSTENGEEQRTTGFTDKIKEFDEFLEDFDIPIRNQTPEPENRGVPVNEELIRPEVVQRTSAPILERDLEEDSSPMVQQQSSIRSRRSLVDTSEAEKGIVDKLAQQALNVLDDIDVDNNKRIVLGVIDSKKEEIHDGTVYHVTMKVAPTNCDENQEKNIAECLENVREPTKICKVQIHTDNKATLASAKVLQLQCYLQETPREIIRVRREQIPGGLTQKNIDDPEIRAYAEKGLRKYSEISDSQYEPFLVEILEATSQVVSGMLYKIKVRLGESTCPKGTKENCLLKEESNVDEYLISVWSQPWIDKGNPDIKVEAQSKNNKVQRVRRSEGLLGGPTQRDPNDPEIRAYVDQGLRKFSETSGSENEPFLVEILEATSQVVSGMAYKIKVRLGESTCPKGTKENCQLKEESNVDEYLISVWSQPWIDKGNPDIKVESQSKNDKVQRVRRSEGLLGGPTQRDPNDPEIRAYVDKGLRKFSETSGSQNEPFLVEILEATSQVVSGMAYKIKVRLGESTCPKGTKGNCQLKKESNVDEYLISVWSQPWIDKGNPDIKVESQSKNNKVQRVRRSEGLPGGHTQRDPNDPEIRAYVDQGLRKFSETSGSENEPFLVEILEATSQVVSGMAYKIKVRLGESTCPKGTKENCQLKEESNVDEYLISVWSQPWIDKGNPDIKVESQSKNNKVQRVRRSEGLPGGHTQRDPNDPEIRAYVDKGLRKFSETSGSENEPFLVEILEATSQVVSGMLYKIKVRLGESTCPKGTKENCQLKEESNVDEYLISVWSQPWIDKGNPDIKVEAQSKNNKVQRVRRSQGLFGGHTQRDPNDPEIRAYVDKGLQKFSETSGSENEPFLVEILEATSQVVSGTLYKIKVRLGESTCSKGTKENCQLKEESNVDEYLISVWSQPWVDKGIPDIKVESQSKNDKVQRVRRSGQRLGGVEEKDPNDPEIREYVDKGLQKFSETSGSENEPFLVEILEATSQVVSGTLYKIKVRLGESTCSKGTKENCQLKEESNVDEYLISVWSQPWVDKGIPDIKVESQSKNDKVQRVRRSGQRLGGVEEKDPNDPEIREYVDKGLRKFSETSGSENEPFLVKILEATSQVVSGTLYKIKVRLGESTCPKGNKENCQLKEKSNVDDYLITVWSQPWLDKGNPKITIESQSNNAQVQRVRRSEHRPGGVEEKDSNDPEIRGYVDKGLQKFSETSESANEPFLVEILRTTTQVLSGTLYTITVRLGESTCPKGTKENCQLKQESDVQDYLITVLSQPWRDHGNPKIEIERAGNDRPRRQTLKIKGRPTQVSPNDPQIQAYAQQGAGVFSSKFDGPYEHLLAEITEASVQTVSGKLYKIKVKLGESNCPKGTNKDCQLKPDGERKDCIITVWSQPWIDEGKPDFKVDCSSSPLIRKKKSLRGVNYNAKMLNLAQDIRHERDFQNFISKYEKVYASEEERKARFEIFKANMKLVEKLRENEQGTAVYGASIFADVEPEEFRAKYLGLKPQLRSDNQIPFPQAQIPDIKLPKEFDWRHYNVVTEVKNQQACGSCWAFSVTGNVESLYAIKTGRLLSLSEQELVDCDTLDSGCEGGLPDNAYRAIEALGGLELETDYPYDGRDEKCHFDKSKARVNVLSGLNITRNETGMAQWLVKNGPISIGINANAMQFYMGGISHPFKFLCSPDNLDHGVLIVGYGVHTYPIFKKTMPYWIIKNSWGPSWGEQGYYRVFRGAGTCGLNMMASSAVLG